MHLPIPRSLRLAALLVLAAALSACALLPGTPAASPAPPPAPAPAAAPAPAPPPVLQPVEAEPRAPATQLQPPAPGPLDAGGPVGAVLAHAERIRGLSGAELNAEIARQGEAAAAGGNPVAQMQQALALTQTRVYADLVRALGLLQRVSADASPEAQALRPLARLLATRLQEQRRAEEERDRLGQQLRDAQRRLDQLSDRLEALRAIERSFGRPAPAAAPPAPPAAPAAPANGGHRSAP